MASVHAPAVSATVLNVEARAAKVEVVAVWVAGVDAEVPVASRPVYRAVEVSGVAEGAVLPVEEYVAHVEIAVAPVGAVEVVDGVYPHEVVEVYLVCRLVLVLRQVQLVSHLVGKEQSFVACLLITHC